MAASADSGGGGGLDQLVRRVQPPHQREGAGREGTLFLRIIRAPSRNHLFGHQKKGRGLKSRDGGKGGMACGKRGSQGGKGKKGRLNTSLPCFYKKSLGEKNFHGLNRKGVLYAGKHSMEAPSSGGGVGEGKEEGYRWRVKDSQVNTC